MRVVVACGGTGGHVYPALAIAGALRDADPAVEIRFIGGHGPEARVVPAAGWPFQPVAARQLSRRISWRICWALLVTAWGTGQAIRILTARRPDVVVSTGGYAAAPVGAAAALLRLPLVLQEQNLTPGLTNRLLRRFARVVSVPHQAVAPYFGGKAVVTGVPVRADVLRGDRATGLARFGLDPERTTVLVLGGSQGARSINDAVTDAAPQLADPGTVQVLHQTGPRHVEAVRSRAAQLRALRYVAVGYIDDVADAYACADLVVCRAGAATLAEVTAYGLPFIAVPYPYAAEGHQERNARQYERDGAAVVVLDRDLTGSALADLLNALRADPNRLRAMAAASQRLGRPDAAAQVAALVSGTAGQERM